MTDQERFDNLAKRWHRATGHLSSLTRSYQDPAYREIRSMGPAAVPLVARELLLRPGWWFDALRRLTGGGPEVPERDRGRLYETRARWLWWLFAHGHLPVRGSK